MRFPAVTAVQGNSELEVNSADFEVGEMTKSSEKTTATHSLSLEPCRSLEYSL